MVQSFRMYGTSEKMFDGSLAGSVLIFRDVTERRRTAQRQSMLVGELNHCSWCIDFGRSLSSGATREKGIQVQQFETHPGFSEAERAALRYALESTQTPVNVSDETFAALRRHYSDRQIVELTFAVAIENFFNRVNAPLGVEAEGFCAIAPPDITTDRAVA